MAKKSPFKILLFDLGGVVLAYDYAYTYTRLEQLGVSKEKTQLFFNCKEYEEFSRGKISEEAFCTALKKHLNNPNLTLSQLKQAHHLQIFGIIKGMKGVINKLSKKYKIVFVTNNNPWQNERQEELINLKKYQILKSNEIRMRKADPTTIINKKRQSFFKKTLEILNTKPDETLLIDDSIEKINAAKNEGIIGILFRGTREKLEEDLSTLNINL